VLNEPISFSVDFPDEENGFQELPSCIKNTSTAGFGQFKGRRSRGIRSEARGLIALPVRPLVGRIETSLMLQG